MTDEQLIEFKNQSMQDGKLNLSKFADLVAAHQREKVSQWMMAQSYATGHGDTIEDLLEELEWQINEKVQK